MNARALVTGVTGLLGGHIADVLGAAGWEVRALARSAAAGESLRRRGVEPRRGSLEDFDALVEAATGCDAIFHAAAAIGSDADLERYRRVNVVGTRNVLEAARNSGARLVHVSTTSVYGRARYGDHLTDETARLPELPATDVYGRTKQEAERLVLDACASGRVWVTVVRPPVMYGPGDRQFAPRIGPVMERGIFPLVGDGLTTLALAHARNVAEGAVLAATAECARGRVYLLAYDHPTTVLDLVRGAASGLGRRIRTPRVPLLLGHVGFATLALGLRAIGRADLARHARGTLEMLTRDNPFTSARARAELGWRPSVLPEEGLPEAFRWWKAHRSPRGASRSAERR